MCIGLKKLRGHLILYGDASGATLLYKALAEGGGSFANVLFEELGKVVVVGYTYKRGYLVHVERGGLKQFGSLRNALFCQKLGKGGA